jgi:two-component system phosphate regulon sensor histidine kinase PhoR
MVREYFRAALKWLLAASILAILSLGAGASAMIVLPVWALSSVLLLLLHSGSHAKNLTEEIPEDHDADLISGLQAAFSALDMPVFILDGEANILFGNQAADLEFGEVLIGAHVSAKFRAPALLDLIRDTLVAETPHQIEHIERLPGEKTFIARMAPLMLPERTRPPGHRFVLSFRDISETRRIDRMRSDFVANASHELRTPLASVRGFIETLQGPAKGDVKVHERFLGIMLEQVTRMTRMVDDLLSLSRLELKAQIPPLAKVELGPVLGHVRDSLMPLARELGLDISLTLPESPVLVTGDQDELIEVFENLVENACKYGQDGKRVDIVLVRDSENQTDVTVHDYGPGIPEEHIPRLTERFYRVNVEASRSKKGTGLGLAIVKHILTRHRARLIVKSDPGNGTSFTVRFLG